MAFIAQLFITTFALRAKRAHLGSLCCLQCTSQVTIEQNIQRNNLVPRVSHQRGWQRNRSWACKEVFNRKNGRKSENKLCILNIDLAIIQTRDHDVTINIKRTKRFIFFNLVECTHDWMSFSRQIICADFVFSFWAPLQFFASAKVLGWLWWLSKKTIRILKTTPSLIA